MRVTHLYGLTETYGPIAVCAWQPGWDALPAAERMVMRSRQGVGDGRERGATGRRPRPAPTCPPTARRIGEIVMRGNNVADRLLPRRGGDRAPHSRDGWFHSGDLGVMHPDGYVEIRDRLKDMIISGGENISSIEVEHGAGRAPRRASRWPWSGSRTSSGARCRRRIAVRPATARTDAGRHARVRPRPPGAAQGAEDRSSSSTRCPRPRPARCRSTSCATGGETAARWRVASRPLRPHRQVRDRHRRRHRHRPADGRCAGRAGRERRALRAQRGALHRGGRGDVGRTRQSAALVCAVT